jgi:archaellum component FlaG (FlaF/FlaG flagellin family)
MRRMLLMLMLVGCIVTQGVCNISLVSRLTEEQWVSSGDEYAGTIRVKNTGNTRGKLKVYQREYYFDHTGVTRYDILDDRARSNASWIALQTEEMMAPPKAEASITYKVMVPNDPHLRGTYWSAIMVEIVNEDKPQFPKERSPSELVRVGFTQSVRYAIQVVCHIGNDAERNLQFLETEVNYEKGKKRLAISVKNVGEQMLKTTPSVEVYDTGGNYINTFTTKPKRTFPGTSVKFNLDIHTLKEGEYEVVVLADCGEDSVFGTTYTLAIPK